MADRQQFIVRLDPDFLAQIDAEARKVGLSRNRWVEAVLRQELAPPRTIKFPQPEVSPRPPVAAPRAAEPTMDLLERRHAPTCRCAVCQPPKG